MLKKMKSCARVFNILLAILLLLQSVAFMAPGSEEEGLFQGRRDELVPEPLVLTDLEVAIWPEYDRAETLVIFTGKLRNDSSEDFTGRLKFLMPGRSDLLLGKAEMVCETEFGMKCIQYEIREMGDGYGELTWTPTTTIGPGQTFPFMFEYYYDPLDGDVIKTLRHEFFTYYNIENFVFSVKPPVDAKGFFMEPVAQWDSKGGDGFTNFYNRMSTLSAGESISFLAGYNRVASGPSYAGDSSAGASRPTGVGISQISRPIQSLLLLFFVVTGGFVAYAVKSSGKSSYKNSKVKANKAVKKQVKTAGEITKKKKTQPPSTEKKGPQSGERKKARRLLLEGKISEETYNRLVAEIDEDDN
ncbi:MAG: hypothetical protein KGZ79_01970 [Dethiobacter sp.]|jgi:hypothetical protein|nr:hypothetical protein [Dethiobacter sp.]